jgi:hypothetical protein
MTHSLLSPGEDMALDPPLIRAIVKWQRPLLWAVLCLCIVRYWILPLPSSFWIDETGTAFVVHYGASHPSFAVAPQVPASIYYVLPALAERIAGFSEISYRLPSLLLMAIALILIYRLAAILIHPDAGWAAVFACLSLRGFNYQAADARPYALGTCVSAACLYFLVKWFNEGRLRDAILWVMLAALVWRVHLIYWPFYVVPGLYAVLRFKENRAPEAQSTARPFASRAGLLWTAALLAMTALLLIPTAMEAITLSRQAKAHVIADLPRFSELFRQMHVNMVVGAFVVGTVLVYWLRWARNAWNIPTSGVALIAGWWMCQPILLFAYSHITGNSVFVPRYLSLSLAGTGLATVAAAAVFIPPRFWKPLALVFGLVVFVVAGEGWSWKPAHHNSDWRGAVRKFNALGLPPDTPVIVPSPYIEAQSPVWQPDYPLPGFLYSHLPVYPLQGKVYLFPFKASSEADRYASDLAAQVLPQHSHFAIYGGDRNVWLWQWKLSHIPELAGWHWRALMRRSDVQMIVFERPEKAAASAKPDQFPAF